VQNIYIEAVDKTKHKIKLIPRLNGKYLSQKKATISY